MSVPEVGSNFRAPFAVPATRPMNLLAAVPALFPLNTQESDIYTGSLMFTALRGRRYRRNDVNNWPSNARAELQPNYPPIIILVKRDKVGTASWMNAPAKGAGFVSRSNDSTHHLGGIFWWNIVLIFSSCREYLWEDEQFECIRWTLKNISDRTFWATR